MTSILKLRELMIFMHHHNEEDAWWNNIPYEVECKGEIECYDKINEFHPKYPLIIYNNNLYGSHSCLYFLIRKFILLNNL